MAGKIITAIDLGSHKISAAAASIDRKGGLSILGLENINSRGVSGGEIIDLDKAVEDISAIVKKLERAGSKKIKHVYVTAKCADIKIHVSRGMIPLSRSARAISKKDIKKCLDMTSIIKLPIERVVIEKIIKGFYVDESREVVRNPLGLYGVKLEAEAFVATVSRSKMQNITKAVDHAGLLLDGVFLSSTASAGSVLDADERERGAIILDIGDTLTEEITINNNTIKSFGTVDKGARHILAEGGGVDREKLRVLLDKARKIVPEDAGSFLGVVVTGGGALLDGLIEEVEKIFKLESRIGIVKKEPSLNTQDAMIHTATIGLLRHIKERYKKEHVHNNPIGRALHKALEIYESYF